MNKLVIGILLGLLALLTPVHAGTIAITVTTASGACSSGCSKSYSDTDANLAKIAASYQAGCNAKLAGTCTMQQVLSYWFDSVISAAVANVTGFDKSNLAASATSGYVPINPQ